MEYIPLEKPIAELEIQIAELRRMAVTQAINLDNEILELEKKADKLRHQMFAKLTPYEVAQISRHPKRPNSLEVIHHLTSDWLELHGDRNFKDDSAIVAGIGRIEQQSYVIIGHQKGRGTKGNIERNFGMPRPEGYRKALRLMSMAERFGLPILTFIDTPGAYPGIGAEQRGQSEAIGKNILVMSRLKVPILTFILGEGGSGGALALGVANRVYMLKYAIYSVISPEGCASILMKDAAQAATAANALQLTANCALNLGIIDNIIDEPIGGAHRKPLETFDNIKKQIISDTGILSKHSGKRLQSDRNKKFLSMNFTKETAS